jgi:hypothetical protein
MQAFIYISDPSYNQSSFLLSLSLSLSYAWNDPKIAVCYPYYMYKTFSAMI